MRGVSIYFLFVICVVSLDAGKFRCDYTYTNVGWLKYHEIPAIWRDARMRCRFEGAVLLSPTTESLKFAMVNVTGNVDIFTGFHAIFSQGNFYTIDGIPLDAIDYKWEENEPNNKDNAERCITMNSRGKFSDVSCDIPRPYICHRANSSESTSICGTIDEEYHPESRTNKCYKFHKTARTYERAHFVCSAEGGHLAIINSAEESQVIREIFAKYPPNTILGPEKDVALIGFNNYGESADWTTLHGQTLEQAGFQQFFNGQPDNKTAGEYCGGVHRHGLLFDLWCESHFPFICEKDANEPGLCDSNDFHKDGNCSDSRFKLLHVVKN